ncbi:MAG: hypothetical protein ACXQS2_01795 [Methermicoccaceae archaeon]
MNKIKIHCTKERLRPILEGIYHAGHFDARMGLDNKEEEINKRLDNLFEFIEKRRD